MRLSKSAINSKELIENTNKQGAYAPCLLTKKMLNYIQNKKDYMKFIVPYIIIFILSGFMTYAQRIESTGIISNGGTLKVKGAISSTENSAKILNSGRIVVEGNAYVNQDTLGGRVEFYGSSNLSTNFIPKLVYKDVKIGGTTKKTLMENSGRDFVALTKFESDTSTAIIFDTTRSIFIFGETHHNGRINPHTRKGRISLSGLDTQMVYGSGNFKELELNNESGADVIKGGGFRINTTLDLKRGTLRNSKENNFIMEDNSRIIRNTAGAIAYTPEIEKGMSVHYTGEGSLTSGPEIPTDHVLLDNFYANVSGQVVLDRNINVQDTLEVGSMIIAERDTLILHGTRNPMFTGADYVEIDGNFLRHNIISGDTLLLNSPYHWVFFADEAGRGAVTSLSSTIRRRMSHELPGSEEKVRRAFTLWGLDVAGNKVENEVEMYLGFGWRSLSNPDYDESNGLNAPELVFQHWLDDSWIDITPKNPPSVDFGTGWATGMVEKLSSFGHYAVGMPGGGFWAFSFQAKFFLEGAYIAGSRGLMKHDLWSSNLLALADLSQYPTSLDASLTPEFLTQIPDSVVDIVVLEFRKERNAAPDIVKTGFLKYDGTFVDVRGRDRIQLDSSDGIPAQGAKYHIAVRHRNHSAVITEQAVEINKTSKDVVYNLSDPSLIEGGTANLKLVFVDIEDGTKVFALKGGFLADDAEGLDNQMNILSNYTRNFEHQSTFNYFTRTGYLNTDFNLSGIVNTKDFNVTWNNRGKN